MTLIAAFRCREGAVLCADTMESTDAFRTSVRKLEQYECNHYWLAIAGAGNADLIDGFAYELSLAAQGWIAGHSEAGIGSAIRETLLDFHRNELAVYPDDEPEKRTNFIVCVKPKAAGNLSLWRLKGSTIAPIGDYGLMGVDATLYLHELKKLYGKTNVINDGRTVNRFGRIKALLLGIHLFSFAKDTSTSIGGDTEAIYIDEEGMQKVDPEDIKLLESRIAVFNDAIADVVLQCPDTTTQDPELFAYLDNFRDTVMGYRKSFAEHAARVTVGLRLSDSASQADPYLHIGENFAVNVPADINKATIEPKDIENPEPGFIKRKKMGRVTRSPKADS